MPPMQDKFSHSTESGGEAGRAGAEGAERAPRSGRRGKHRDSREEGEEVEVRLGHGDAASPSSSQKRPCYATSRRE